ncbi:MAG: DUF116 domain-containing protein [Desulfovermiculus sp.]
MTGSAFHRHTPLNDALVDTFESKKRVFIGLLSGTSLLVVLLLALAWLIPYVGLSAVHPLAPWFLGGLLLLTAALILWSTLALILNILCKRPILFSRKIRGITIKCFLPLMTLVGKILGISQEKVRASFIQVNNEMVTAEGRRYSPDEILLLMPHCLQNSRCKYRLTYNISNCRRCGECPIAGLLSLSEEFGVHLAIATGGTIARRIVVQTRPKIILAVACERDLASGIQDTYPLPVFGILNQRPHGPCLDTNVDLDQVRYWLNSFLKIRATVSRHDPDLSS